MIEQLFIAEKPSLAKAIADAIPGEQSKPDGTYIQIGNVVVTWVFGHLLEQAQPDDYGNGWEGSWSFSQLPMVPPQWKLKLKGDGGASKQFNSIKRLLKEAKVVVNAGDPDREGQLLVDELLEYIGNTKPTKRILAASLDIDSMKRSLGDLRDNKDFYNLYQSGLGRSRADWLIGMNLTRAYTLAAKPAQGRGPVVSVGRVQTPSLALVVQRDLEIENFKPLDYFVPEAKVKVAQGEFLATWRPKNTQAGLDAEGRLVDPKVAEGLRAKVMASPMGAITEYKVTDEKTLQPMPYTLTTLSTEAGKKFGYTPSQVMEICQSLYETHKVTSYPRSECEFLPESQHGDHGKILAHLSSHFPVAQGASGAIKSRAWNTKKVEAHHGIIPTTKPANLNALSPKERDIYQLICLRYIAQFYPEYKFRKVLTEAEFAGETFRATGNTPVHPGWKAVYGTTLEEDDEKERSTKIPPITKGERAQCLGLTNLKKQTSPPARFTESSLAEAMSEVHKFVKDEKIKKMLRDRAGIGTTATRPSIIKTLFNRNYLVTVGRGKKEYIQSTEAGRTLINALPVMMRDPGMTAVWEGLLDAVKDGEIPLDTFLDKQVSFMSKMVADAKTMKLHIAYTPRDGGGKPAASSSRGSSQGYASKTSTGSKAASSKTYSKAAGTSRTSGIATDGETCPKCNSGTMVERTVKNGANAGKKFHSCNAYPKCNHAVWPK